MKGVISIASASLPLGFQDAGRLGRRRFGVPLGGVIDPTSAKMANLMVDNYADQVVLEFAFGGVELKFLKDQYLAVVGAGGINKAKLYRAGESLEVPIRGGHTWGYIAVPSGFLTGSIFGSASYNARAGWGEALAAGSLLETVANSDWPSSKPDRYPSRQWLNESFDKEKVIRVAPGFTFDKVYQNNFLEKTWKVSNLIDRSGYRLDGDLIAHDMEVKSAPVVVGAIQVTPQGQPIVTMPDGPTVGGYPVVAYIHPDDVSHLAQRVPGSTVRFETYDFSEL